MSDSNILHGFSLVPAYSRAPKLKREEGGARRESRGGQRGAMRGFCSKTKDGVLVMSNLSAALLQDEMESFTGFIFHRADQKAALVSQVVHHLVTEQDVDARRALSIHMINFFQWKAAHGCHLAD